MGDAMVAVGIGGEKVGGRFGFNEFKELKTVFDERHQDFAPRASVAGHDHWFAESFPRIGHAFY